MASPWHRDNANGRFDAAVLNAQLHPTVSVLLGAKSQSVRFALGIIGSRELVRAFVSSSARQAIRVIKPHRAIHWMIGATSKQSGCG
jgi:hypothetical protein